MASASSSKHQWPSSLRSARSAAVAVAIALLDLLQPHGGRAARCRTQIVAECQDVAFHAALLCRPSRSGARAIAAAAKIRSGSILRSSPAGRFWSSRRRGTGCRRSPRFRPLAHSAPASRRRSPGARARSASAAASGAEAGERRHLAPDRLGQALARLLHQPVGAADRDRQPVREGEDPFRRRVDDAEDRRLAGRRRDAEMRVDDGVEFLRHGQARKQRCARRPAERRGSHDRPGQAGFAPRRNRARMPRRRRTGSRAATG